MIMSKANGSEGDWSGYHQNFLSSQELQGSSLGISSPIPENTVLSSAGPTTGRGGATQKAARRRSRASRKAPTTLFNTDAANFRAMVQQFTGAPSLVNQGEHQQRISGGIGPTTLSFGLGVRPQIYSQQPSEFPAYPVQQPRFQQYNQNQGSQFFFDGGAQAGTDENADAFVNPQGGYSLDGTGSSGGMPMDSFPSR